MNTSQNNVQPLTGKIARTVGNIASYVFWITTVLIAIGFFTMLAVYELPVFSSVGKILAIVAVLMALSVSAMVASMKVLQRNKQW